MPPPCAPLSTVTPLSEPVQPSFSRTYSNATPLYITALTNHPSPPYNARLECWSLANTFTTYPTVGRALSLGNVDNATYVVLPPRSAEGWHRPPHLMFFVLLSGLAQVFAPRTNRPMPSVDMQFHAQGPAPMVGAPTTYERQWDVITIAPGSPQQVLIAGDTDMRSPGHLTYYPGDGETVALQIPISGGVVPEHTVVHEGGCTGDEGEGRV
ncbi:hypothetical protein G647_06050 [Cladophialophora carrionii CBS 160.54]|uniref:Uncharacterized protein n=1 Tax=Cladophialophora carrionii CBS 160.54 TaxID=1279043 RepID=V9D536_9EURO|nr:uncharacterized protein G647_06050 [Cladophialophora carrionii CBS 160.54]ETI21980.1 hypothetical protein G647_06050 [Cladophialophora carrionii CBS 160.54]